MGTITDARETLGLTLEDYLNFLLLGGSDPTSSESITENLSVVVIFYYDLDELFEEIKQYSAIKAKLFKDDKGNPVFEEYTITEDEKTYVVQTLVYDAALEIFEKINYLSTNIGSAFIFNEGEDILDYVGSEIPVPPEWDINTTYQIGDFVTHLGNTWRALSINTGVEPSFQTPEWMAMVPDPVSTSYTKGTYVIYLGKYYLAIEDSTGVLPTNTEYWQEVSKYVDTYNHISMMITLPADYNNNALQRFDRNIWNLIKSFAVREWWRMKGKLDEYQLENMVYEKLCSDLRFSKSQRNSKVRRSYKILGS